MAELVNALIRGPEPVKPSPGPSESLTEQVSLLEERVNHIELTLALYVGRKSGEGLFSRVLRKIGFKTVAGR